MSPPGIVLLPVSKGCHAKQNGEHRSVMGRTKGTSPTFFAVFCHKKINVTGCSSQVSASERSGRATASQWDTCPWPLYWKSVAELCHARGYTHPGTYTGIDKSLVLLLSFLFVLAEKETLLLGLESFLFTPATFL